MQPTDGAAFVRVLNASRMQMVPFVTLDELETMCIQDKTNVVVLDVRSKEEFKQG